MTDRFLTVLAVLPAHRRETAVHAAGSLAQRGAIPLTVFDISEHDGADVRPTSGRRDVEDVAATLRTRDGALMVLDALGGGPPADPLFDAVAEHLLTHVPLPALVFGPSATLAPAAPVLLVAADGGSACAASVWGAVAWSGTFASHAVVVALDTPDPWPSDAAEPTTDQPRQLAAELAAAGVDVELQRHRTLDAVATLVAAATEVPSAVLVVPAARFPTTTHHWFSTSRQLIRFATAPVLLVPEPA